MPLLMHEKPSDMFGTSVSVCVSCVRVYMHMHVCVSVCVKDCDLKPQ